MFYGENPRTLRWIGQIARMDKDRLPRKMLTAFLPVKRQDNFLREYGRSITNHHFARVLGHPEISELAGNTPSIKRNLEGAPCWLVSSRR